jgi:hypothetical protein
MRMADTSTGASPPFVRVRPIVWVVLAAALLLALAAPIATLWHASTLPLQAQVALWPSAPHAGEAARIVVTVADTTDRTATEGPWARIAAEWDMVQMTMGVRQTVVPGAAPSQGTFTVPLCVDMAGLWWVQVSVSTPGRPVWQTRLRFSVLPPAQGASERGTTASAVAASTCASTGRSAHL